MITISYTLTFDREHVRDCPRLAADALRSWADAIDDAKTMTLEFELPSGVENAGISLADPFADDDEDEPEYEHVYDYDD